MPTLDALLDTELLGRHLKDGYVNRREHPTEPLAILNYSASAQWDRVWTNVTRQCRGLIYNVDTQEIVARPLVKFFNHGQMEAPELVLSTPCVVTDKADGSLGVVFPGSDGWAVATRGSFTSDQAVHATEVLRERYRDWSPPDGCTTMVEIVYPKNRIVVDYGGMDDLIYLTSLRIEDGMPEPWYWPGPIVEEMPYDTLGEALAAEPRPNSEGLVVYFPVLNNRLKIKQESYVILHRIVTGLNERTVWQHMVDGKPIADLVAPLPDEFRPWVEEVAERIATTCDVQEHTIQQDFWRIRDELPVDAGRKEFAEIAKTREYAWALFMLLDGKDIWPRLLYNAKPEAVGPGGRVYSEDVA